MKRWIIEIRRNCEGKCESQKEKIKSETITKKQAKKGETTQKLAYENISDQEYHDDSIEKNTKVLIFSVETLHKKL